MSVLGLSVLLAAAQPVVPLAPNGPWNVQGEDNMCLLAHAFGTADNQLTVGFQPLLKMSQMELIVLRPDRGTEQRVGRAKVSFGPEGKEYPASYFSIAVPGKRTRLFRLTLASDAFDELKTADQMSVDAPPLRLTVRLPKTVKALPAFANCQQELLKSWGVDPAAIDSENAAKFKGNPARYFGTQDYPSEALHAGIYGRVVAILQVDPLGAMTNCRVVISAGKSLNEATCRSAARIKFEPAHDASGKPIVGIVVLPVRWTLPGAPS